MIPKNKFKERVIYQIPNKLIITNRKIKKRRKVYNLENIIQHGIVVNTKMRNRAFVVCSMGILILIIEWFIDNYIAIQTDLTDVMIAGLNDYVITFNAEDTIILIGVFLILFGMIILLFYNTMKYSVVIKTNKGLTNIGAFAKKQAIKVEYAIHEAILYMPPYLFNKEENKNKKPALKRVTSRKRLKVRNRLRVSY